MLIAVSTSCAPLTEPNIPTMFTTACQWSLSWTDECCLHPLTQFLVGSTLILFSYWCLGFHPQFSYQNFFMNFSSLPCILDAIQSHSPSLDHNNILVKGTNNIVLHYTVFSSSLLLSFTTIYSPHNPALKHHLCSYRMWETQLHIHTKF